MCRDGSAVFRQGEIKKKCIQVKKIFRLFPPTFFQVNYFFFFFMLVLKIVYIKSIGILFITVNETFCIQYLAACRC